MAVPRLRHIVIVVISLLEILLFGGLPMGWFSIVFTLKQDKVFEDLCDFNVYNISGNGSTAPPQVDESCFPQDERLNLIFSIGVSTFTVMTVVHGQLYFKFKHWTVRIFTMLEMVAGLLFVGFTSAENPWFPLPGIIFMGVAGMSLMLSNMQVSTLLKKGGSVYVGLINGCYDSSVITLMAIKALYEKGVRRQLSYGGIVVLFIVVTGVSTLLRQNTGNNPKHSQKEGGSTDEVRHTGLSDESDQMKVKVSEAGGYCKSTFYSRSTIIRSRPYLCHLLWMSIVQLRYFYFVGSANRLFGQTLGNIESEVSYFTDVMTYTMLGGVVSSFIAGYTLEVQKKWFTGQMQAVTPLALTSCIAILLSCFTLSSTRVTLYVDFVLLNILRAFLYSTNMVFILASFPLKYSSFLVGVTFSVSGLFALTQFGLFSWTDLYNDATTHVNIVLLCLTVISLLHPFLIFLDHRRRSQEPVQRQ